MAADLQLSSENPYARRSTRNSKEGDIFISSDNKKAEEKCTCSHSGEAEIRACTKPCCKNIGHEILKKQGWTAGRGLGKNLQGPLDAPPINRVLTRLGSNEEVGDVTESTTEKRKLLECERETTEELAHKYEQNAQKEKAREASLAGLKSSYYCELCDKQYLQHADFDNHVNSYDHAHVKRLKDLKQQQIRSQLSASRLRDDKIKEKDLKRITEFAEARAERGSEDGEGTVDADCTTVFYDDDTPDMPPLPQGVNIMDTVCPDTIPLPPDPNKPRKSDSSDPEHSPSKENSAELGGHSTISFALKGKQSSALPGQSIFKEEEEANRRKLNFPRRKKIVQKKPPTLSFVPKSDDKDKTENKAAAEKEAEELYPSQPTAEDARPKPHFKKMTFVQSAENLGGTKAEVKPVVAGPANKPDLLQFVKVTRLEEGEQLDWPAEMIQTTNTAPPMLFSCNPLMFDFGLLTGKPKAKPAADKAEKKDKKKKKSKKHKKKSKSSKRNEDKEKDEDKGNEEVKSDKTKSNKKKSKKKSKKKKSKKAESDSESNDEKKAADETAAKTDAQKGTKKSKKHRKKSSKRNKKSSRKAKESESESDVESEEEKNVSKENAESKAKPDTPKKAKKLVKKKKKVEESGESEESDQEETTTKVVKKQYRKRTNSATQQQAGDADPKTGAKKKKVKKKGATAATVPTKAEAAAANKAAQKRLSDAAAPGGKKRIKMEEDGGRVSDFEGAKDKGQSKWETSSDSELENIVKSETKNKKTVRTKKSNAAKAVAKKPVKQGEGVSRRSRRDSELSDRRSSHRSHHSSSSRDRSRSYSDDSYYTYSSRSRSDSRDSRYYTSSDYYTDYTSRSRSRSRSYRSRSRGRRHHSDSYSSSSRSRSRSYSRDRRSRSYSRRRRSYSRSSRSYTRSRSRHRTRSRSRRRQLQPSPDPRFSSLKRPQNNKLRRQLSKKPFKPGPVRPFGINGEIQPLMDKIIPKPGEKPPNQENDDQASSSAEGSSVPTISAKKVNVLEGDRPRPEMSEEEKKKREKLIQDIAARMEKEAEEAEKAIKDKVASVTKPETIPIPAPHNSQTIPLPAKPAPKTPTKVNKAGASGVFIGPVQPGTSNIPLPSTDKFQHIGPNDPLVFKKPLSGGDAAEAKDTPDSAAPSDEKASSSSFMIPPEQAEKYKALQDQVRKHLARQRGEVVESSDEEEEVTQTAETDEVTDETTEIVSPALDEAQLLAQLTPQLVPITPGVIAGVPIQAGAPVMLSTSHAQAVALAQAQQAQAIQQAQLIQAAQVQAAAQQQAAQAQLAAQIQNQQALALAHGQVLVQPQVAQGALVQTSQGLVRVPTVQPQVVSGAQLQQLQLQRAMAAQQQGTVLVRGATPMLVRVPLQRPM